MEDLKDLRELVDTGADFNLQNQKLILTYADIHLPKDEFVGWLIDITGIKPKFCRLAHETYKDGGLHTHVVIDFGIVYRKRRAARWFDWKDHHPMIKVIKTSVHWKRCVAYLAKEDPENADLAEAKKSWQDLVSCSTTKADALKFAMTPSQVQGILTAYDILKENVREIETFDFYKWQEQMMSIYEKPADDRTIYWIYDQKGASGKTYFCKWLKINYMNDVLLVNAMGGQRDFSTIVNGALDTGWTGRCCCVNLSRSAEGKAIYAPLEDLKDGLFTTTKYCGRSLLLPQKTHVFVFANWLPVMFNMSLDRWRIFEVDSERDMHLLTLKEVLDIGGLDVGEA